MSGASATRPEAAAPGPSVAPAPAAPPSQGSTATATVDGLLASDAPGLRSRSQNLAESGSQLRDGANAAREDAFTAWDAPARERAQHRVDSSANQLSGLGLSVSGVAVVARAVAEALSVARTVVAAGVAAARSAHLVVHPNGSVEPPPGVLALERATSGLPLPAYPAGMPLFAPLCAALSATLRAALALVEAAEASGAAAVGALSAVDAPPAPRAWTPQRPARPSRTVYSPAGPVNVTGDLRAAETIITLVSGVNSSDQGAVYGTQEWAEQLVAQAEAEGKRVAVVTFHAYTAPGSVAEAVSPAAATQAAPVLRQLQAELRNVNPDAQLHLTGYSYGSVVVGAAATGSQDSTSGARGASGGPGGVDIRSPLLGPAGARVPDHGVDADRVTFLGSPGVQAHSSGELDIHAKDGNAEVSAFRVPGDLIGLTTTPWLGAHGPDPVSPDFAPPAAAPPGNSVPGNSGPGAGESSDTTSWGRYAWDRVVDAYLWAHGEWNSHSSYLSDPEIDEHFLGPAPTATQQPGHR